MTRIKLILAACLACFIAISVTYSQPKSIPQRVEARLEKMTLAEHLMIGSAPDDIRLQDSFNPDN